jgi:hypothetical protein
MCASVYSRSTAVLLRVKMKSLGSVKSMGREVTTAG